MLAHGREELSEVVAAARLAFEAASAHHGLVAQLVLRQLLCALAACLGLARDGFHEEVDLLVARLRQVKALAAQRLQMTLALWVDGGRDAAVDVISAHPTHRSASRCWRGGRVQRTTALRAVIRVCSAVARPWTCFDPSFSSAGDLLVTRVLVTVPLTPRTPLLRAA